MSGPPPGGGQSLGAQPPPASLTLSATDFVKTSTSSALQGATKPATATPLVGTTKVPLITHHTSVMPRPILAAPTIGSAQLKVIQTSAPGQTSNQVQLQSSAPQDQPVDLVAPKSKTVGQVQTTIASVISHAAVQPVSTCGQPTVTPIAIATSTTGGATTVKLGASTTATPIQTLRIPTIPAVSTLRPGSPQVISAPQVLHGTRTNVSIPRAPGQPALAVAVPKPAQGTVPNLAVVHQVPQGGGNKVTVLQQGANLPLLGKRTTFQTAGKSVYNNYFAVSYLVIKT